jgi:hypothetical protein
MSRDQQNNLPAATNDILDVEEAAGILKVSGRFVQQHATELGGVAIGGSQKRAGRWRFSRQKLVEFIQTGRTRKTA